MEVEGAAAAGNNELGPCTTQLCSFGNRDAHNWIMHCKTHCILIMKSNCRLSLALGAIQALFYSLAQVCIPQSCQECLVVLQKRLKEDENLALEYSATDLFEGTSIAKRKAWLDMADSGRRKYDKLAEGEEGLCYCALTDNSTCCKCMLVGARLFA